jgi:hypothetical protein
MLPVTLCRWVAAFMLPAIALAKSHSLMQRDDTQQWSKDLLKESMDWLDMYYDAEAGYLYSLDAAALTHETRASAWYAAGLLARNEADDVEQAVKIVENIIMGQHKNQSAQWLGLSRRRLRI